VKMRMGRGVIAALMVLCRITPTLAADAPPRFEDYPVMHERRVAGPVVLRLSDHRLAARYRTMLRTAATRVPNFAGHYIVAAWGCGTGCTMGAVINATDGEVVWLPGTVCCATFQMPPGTERIAYRLESGLLILRGLLNERPETAGAHYYRIDRDHLVHLRDVAFAAPG